MIIITITTIEINFRHFINFHLILFRLNLNFINLMQQFQKNYFVLVYQVIDVIKNRNLKMMDLFLWSHFMGTIALNLLYTCFKKETKDNHYINTISFDIYQQFIKKYFDHFTVFIIQHLQIFQILRLDQIQHFQQGLLKFCHFFINTSLHLIKPIEYQDQCTIHLSNCNYINQINQIRQIIAIIIVMNLDQTALSIIFDLAITTIIANYS